MKTTIITLAFVLAVGSWAQAQGNGNRSAGPRGDGMDRNPQQERMLKHENPDWEFPGRDKARSENRDRLPPPLTREQREEILKKYDADGDGRLDAEERRASRDAVHAKVLERFDANGNGELDPAERKQARAAMKKQQAMRPNRKALKERFDRDGDGTLNKEERRALRDAMKERREERRNSKPESPEDPE